MKSSENDRYDLSEQVEHLRTIHFTLLLSCMAFLITSQFLPDKELYSALAQIQTIQRRVVPRLKDKSLHDFGEAAAQDIRKYYEQINHYRNQERMIDIGGRETLYRELKTYGYWTTRKDFTGGKPIEIRGNESHICKLKITYRGDTENSRNYSVYIKPASDIKIKYNEQLIIPPLEKGTLEEVQVAWDVLVKYKTIRIPWRWDIVNPQINSIKWVRAEVIDPETTEEDKFYVSFVDENYLSGEGLIPAPEGVLNPQPTPFTFRIRAKLLYEEFEIKPGSWFSKIGNNEFEQTFDDLIQTRRRLKIEEDSLAKIEEVLSNEIKLRTESISAFGLKIPSALVTSWAALIVIGLQLYFLMHLRFYCELLKRDYTYKVAWIGYYKDYISKSVVCITVLLMPVTTVYYLIREKLYDQETQNHLTLLLIIMVSAAVSTRTIKYLLLMWKKYKNIDIAASA